MAVVGTCAKAATSLMICCPTWSATLEPFMRDKMKEINKKFAKAQEPAQHMKMLLPVHQTRKEMQRLLPKTNAEIAAEVPSQSEWRLSLLNEHERRVEEDEEAIGRWRDEISSFKLSAGCFDPRVADEALETAVNEMSQECNLKRGSYQMGEDPVRFYVAMGMLSDKLVDKVTFHAPYAKGHKPGYILLHVDDTQWDPPKHLSVFGEDVSYKDPDDYDSSDCEEDEHFAEILLNKEIYKNKKKRTWELMAKLEQVYDKELAFNLRSLDDWKRENPYREEALLLAASGIDVNNL